MNIIIFGPPGAGKGTISKRLMEDYGLEHLSTGDIIRDHQERGTKIGKYADRIINAGKLLPDNIVIEMVKGRIIESTNESGFIFDGFPRTIAQAKSLDDFMFRRKLRIDAVLSLEVDNNILIQRLLKRGEIENRKDDNLESIKVRMEEYNKETKPLLNYLKIKNTVFDIDGNGSVEEGYNNVKNVISNLQK